MGWADFTSEQRLAYGKKIAANLKAKDPDFYKKIGRKGGSFKVAKGFAQIDPRLHKEISSKGGKAHHPEGFNKKKS